MEFLKVVKRRSFLSEVVYVLLNLALAVAVLGIVLGTASPWLAILLVILSKWRVFAVRPRYWLAHLETNTVDIIVGIGVVVLMYLVGQAGANGAIIVQIVLALLYALWLLLLKPRSKRIYVVAQAGVALLVGTMAFASVSYEWPSSIIVLAMWLIGYASARHVLSAYAETELRLLSLIWGFVIAVIGWLSFHWMIAYAVPFGAGLRIPQMTVIIIALSFLAERVYASFEKHGVVRMGDILLPMSLALGIVAVLIVFFNGAAIGAV